MNTLTEDQPIAIFMEGALGDHSGKMGYGVLRYARNPVACVIDSAHAGTRVNDVVQMPRDCPVVATPEEALALGAQVFLLGIAPAGGQIPEQWWTTIDRAVTLGMSVINGLHNLVSPRYPVLNPGQWIWDIRQEPQGLSVGGGLARELSAKRVLMVGTDMAVGKMTAGLELYSAARSAGVKAGFVATGQIGITIMGSGVPLDAIRVDFASGAIEQQVLSHQDKELVIVEGQGSIVHPGSTSTLPLMRGTCPTHLILCARAGQETLLRVPWVPIPPLRSLIALYEDVGGACGTFARPRCVAVCLDTSRLNAHEAAAECARVTNETGLLCIDPVRDEAASVVDLILN